MPHQITNRRRSYDQAATRSAGSARAEGGGGQFRWEAFNALAYIIGGLMFLVGSAFFLPAFEHYLALGVWLFILGSVFYLAVTAHDLIENLVHYQHQRRLGAGMVLGLVTSVVYVVGSILFVVGSACFLPGLELKDWGAWCFIAGSVLFIAGACVNIIQITQAGSLFTLQLLNIIAICFVVGSVLFMMASIPYLWTDASSDPSLFTYLGAEFIFASLLFLGGGVVNFHRAYLAHRFYSPRQNTAAGEYKRPQAVSHDR